MKIKVEIGGNTYGSDLTKGINISMPLSPDSKLKAWNVADVSIEPVRSGNFVGSIMAGSAVNFMNVSFNPHGNGTHTECLAHITDEELSINDVLDGRFFLAGLVSVTPETVGEDSELSQKGDRLITRTALGKIRFTPGQTALIIRTLPNTNKARNYSGNNPPYFDPETIRFLIDNGIDHLLVDLPSVDREEDGGKVMAHKTFWQIPENPARDRTITELIFVPDMVRDGLYLLSIQIAPFRMDASPSRPILYPVK